MNPILYLKCGGFVSVQASAAHFSTPRSDHGPWTHWELTLMHLCPREAVALLPHPEGAYTPTEVVKAFVKACGGLAQAVDHPIFKEQGHVGRTD